MVMPLFLMLVFGADKAVDLAVSMHANGDDAVDVPAYTDSNVSSKVIKLIQSYVGIVNRMVWRKNLV